MNFIERLVYLRTSKFLYPFVNTLLLLMQIEIPRRVSIGSNLHLEHRGKGIVVNPYTRIGNNVTILHNVTIGNTTPWDDSIMVAYAESRGGYSIDVKDDVFLCAGCVVLCKEHITIGKGTVIGANAVLTCSTGENEIWAGNPAKMIKKRV